jgi:hypothetical protein
MNRIYSTTLAFTTRTLRCSRLRTRQHLPVHGRRSCWRNRFCYLRQAAVALTTCLAGMLVLIWPTAAAGGEHFEGQFYRGDGDAEYLQLLDISRRMFEPDPEFQNLSMFYMPAWNGLVEGPTWDAWWIQNSYGPTYCALPFLQEPFLRFLQNSQDLWFDQMGDGKTPRPFSNFAWVPPDGCLCDAARPGWCVSKQGDGRVDIHDWCMEFTAAGVVMQAELLLTTRDENSIRRYLPKLERSANFVESRRDPKNNLFLAGPAGNLLAPSHAGWKRPDGKFEPSYLAGLSITYIAALDRLIELEKLCGNEEKSELYSRRRELARKGLPLLTTDEGYFIKSLDPDGTRHGVYGAARHGYFEAVSNHDAICFRVADDEQSAKIYRKLASIPGLRRHDLVITNDPGLDDMYVPAGDGLWSFGTWVNGGHWSTCEARMIMAYYRLGKFEDARRSMKKMLSFARRFRMDNPLVAFGDAPYQPGLPINCVYDNWGVPSAMIRGLFEYVYRADGLTIIPHIPATITRLEQHFPIRFGQKRLYLATTGQGRITSVSVNGKPWKDFSAQTVQLPYARVPDEAVLQIAFGSAKADWFVPKKADPYSLPAAVQTAAAGAPAAVPVAVTNGLALRIGADSNGENRFLGAIAETRVFSRALAPKEIAELAGAAPGKVVEDPSLIGDWMPGNRNADMAPNRRGPYLTAKIVGDLPLVDSPRGKAAHFTGRGYLEIAHDPRLDLTEALTLDAWIRPASLPQGGGRIIDKSEVGTSNGFLLDTHPGNSLRLIVAAGVATFDAQLPADKWVHVAATAAGDGKLALYVNGKEVQATRGQSQPVIDRGQLAKRVAGVRGFHKRLVNAGLGESYEATHARLIVCCLAAADTRMQRIAEGRLPTLPAASQAAADFSYLETVRRLCEGLEKVVQSDANAEDRQKRQIHRLWNR